MLSDELVDAATEAFWAEYRSSFPSGGDEGDHDQAVRCGVEAALAAERAAVMGGESRRDPGLAEAPKGLLLVSDAPRPSALPRGRFGAHTVQLDVRDFHRVVVGIEDPDTPAIRRPELRAALIAEEARETLEAITGRKVTITIDVDEATDAGPDLVAAVDGFCDLLCVVYGAAAEFGVDLAPCWDEVHRTNMAKAGGPVRADGKRLKPEGWQPPDLAGILAAMAGAKWEVRGVCCECGTDGEMYGGPADQADDGTLVCESCVLESFAEHG